jgi:hypothetical protein
MVRLSSANTTQSPQESIYQKMSSPYQCQYRSKKEDTENSAHDSQDKDNASVSTSYSTTERVYPKNHKFLEINGQKETKGPYLSFKYPTLTTNVHKMFNSQRNISQITHPRKQSIKDENTCKTNSEKKFVCSSLTFHLICTSFRTDGYCSLGKECPNLHLQPFSRYQSLSTKYFLQLAEVIQNEPKSNVYQILESTEKFDKYMPVFKSIAYRHDKNDMFPEF